MKAGLCSGIAVAATAMVMASPAFAAGWSATGAGVPAASAGSVRATSGGSASCTSGSATVNLTWSASTTSGASYIVLRSKNSGSFSTLTTASGTTATDTLQNGLVVGDTYNYEIQAKIGTNWVSSAVALSGTIRVASVNGGGNAPKC